MCGIIGFFNVKKGITVNINLIAHRGRDGHGEVALEKGKLIHYLHAMVGHSKQPIEGEGILIANCEIYNWKDINKKIGINTSNDSHTLLALLDYLYDTEGIPDMFIKLREMVDGVYSFAYYRDDKVYLMRDVLGVRPLWYLKNDKGFFFSSEGKVLFPLGEPTELHPRHVLSYDIEKNVLNDYYLPWYPLGEYKSLNDTELFNLIMDSVDKRTQGFNRVALLFSGGIDSTVLAVVLKLLGKEVIGYTAGLPESRDLRNAEVISERLGIEFRPVTIDPQEIPDLVEKVVYHTESSDPMKVEVGIPLYVACREAAKEHRMILTGAGGDDVFAGYKRHMKAVDYGHDINRELLSSLRTMYERDLYRDDTVSMSHTIELRLPFLDLTLIDRVINTPPKDKVVEGKKTLLKRVLQYCVEQGWIDSVTPVRLGAQYGSGVNKILKKIAKSKGYSKGQYLLTFQKRFGYINTPLGSLFSGGKDSGLALWMMMKRGYPVRCLITVVSKNPESYMFHVPMIDRVPEIAEKSRLPLIMTETTGEKEKELADLKAAIRKAMNVHGIKGITSGAIASVYQRNRIEEITEHLGIKNYLPLWYVDQEEELKLLFHEGFKVMIIHPSVDPLRPWKNKILKRDDIQKFKTMGINIAGEGGEYETLIIDAPFMKNKREGSR